MYFNMLLILVVVVVYAALLRAMTRRGVFAAHPARRQLTVAVLFGLFAIFATLTGIKLPDGAIANMRDSGPLLAGFIAGPVAGMLAGLIGGAHRLTMGGLTAVPCTAATMLAGVAGGLLYLRRQGVFPSAFYLVVTAFLMEGLHMTLILLMVHTPQAYATVGLITLPMMLANAAAMGIFALIFNPARD